ncbi:MAG TPA: amidase family protein, partial [Acidimicrobiales bacterium]|nr:amidase family protein [Acidimicrobiales bacterium]
VASCLAADLNELSALIGRPIADDELEATNALFASMGRQVTAPTYLASVSWLHRFTRRLSSWWVDHDVLVTPVLGGPPPPLGWLADEAQGLDRVLELIQFTPEFNVSGQPAISLPLATSSEGGLPIGVQLVAAYGREDILLALASDIEAAAPWADRRPAI